VITPVGVAFAARAFFLDVNHFACAADVSIPTDDAPTRQCGEAKQSDNTHDFRLDDRRKSKFGAAYLSSADVLPDGPIHRILTRGSPSAVRRLSQKSSDVWINLRHFE
jgi:hypothetical protein